MTRLTSSFEKFCIKIHVIGLWPVTGASVQNICFKNYVFHQEMEIDLDTSNEPDHNF